MISNDFMKKKVWYNIDQHIIPYFGYYCFFRTLLECLIQYAKERTGNEPYGRLIDYFEGAAEYFLADVKPEMSQKEVKWAKFIESDNAAR